MRDMCDHPFATAGEKIEPGDAITIRDDGLVYRYNQPKQEREAKKVINNN